MCVLMCVVVAGGDGCISLIILADVCQYCRLLIFERLPLLKTISLL